MTRRKTLRVRNWKKRDMTITKRRKEVIRMTMNRHGTMLLRFHEQGRFKLMDILLRSMGMDQFK
jgi:hypothetical protein